MQFVVFLGEMGVHPKVYTFLIYEAQKYFEKPRSLQFYAIGVIRAKKTSLWTYDLQGKYSTGTAFRE